MESAGRSVGSFGGKYSILASDALITYTFFGLALEEVLPYLIVRNHGVIGGSNSVIACSCRRLFSWLLVDINNSLDP